jgi:hypothetical protein
MVTLVTAHGFASADVHGVFRIGLEPLSLEPSADTPFVGGHVDDAVTAYNAASSAYNRAHGYAAGSAMASAPIDRSALGLHETLVTFAPGLEAGTEHVRFRVEGLIGTSDDVRALGVGLYPVNIAMPLRGGSVTPYLVAGGTLRWLSSSAMKSETGGLVTLRAAVGAQLGRRVVVELGVGLFMLGGLYDGAELRSMARTYDPGGSAPPPAPDRVVEGGEQTGMVDISVGFVL